MGDVSQFGIQLAYVAQPLPDDLKQAFIIDKEFIACNDVCFVLGNDLFYGAGLQNLLSESVHVVK